MKFDGVPQKEDSAPKVEGQHSSESKLLSKLRGRLFGAFLLGAAAFTEACGGLTKEDIEKIPKASIEDVLKNPAEFAKMPMIRVEGYPVMAGKEKLQIPFPVFDDEGGLKRFDYITKDTECYDIHSTSDLKSPSVLACSEGSMVYFPYIPLHLGSGTDQMAPHQYVVAGNLKEVRKLFQKTGKYVLEIQGTVDKEATTGSWEKK